VEKRKFTNKPLQTSLGKIAGLFSSRKKITKRKQIQDDQRQQKELLESIIESLTYPFFVVDTKDLSVRIANSAAHKMSDIFGEIKCYALKWDGHQKCGTKEHLCPIDTVMQTKEPVTIEHTCRDKNGNVRYAEVNAYPVFDKEGRVAEVIEYWQDITDSKLAEQQVESLAKFPSEDPNPVLRVSKDGIVLYSNTAGHNILTKWDCRTGQHIPQSWQQYASRILENNNSEILEIESANKTYSFTFAPVVESGYVNIYATDITEHKKVENDLRKYREHLEELVAERTEELTQSNKRLIEEVEQRIWLEREILKISEQEQRKIGQELHDSLGQQLTGIAFMVRVLEQKLDKKKSDETAEAAQISKLINQVTDQTRALAKGLHPVDLNSGTLVSSLQELADSTEQLFAIRCGFHCAKPIEVTETETAIHLYRITQEAITNAIKHGRARNIEIKLSRADNKAILIIENDGKDFPHEYEKPGTGMGLQIMDHRVDLIGGDLTIRKGPKGGTVVTCSFPYRVKN